MTPTASGPLQEKERELDVHKSPFGQGNYRVNIFIAVHVRTALPELVTGNSLLSGEGFLSLSLPLSLSLSLCSSPKH